MAEVETLSVEIRDINGKRRMRRLRESGMIPAVICGHKKASQSLQIPAEQIYTALRHGTRFVALKGALNEKALITECQWDTWGQKLLHLDLTRVGEHEKIRMVVPVELRGEAPGMHEGGAVKQMLYEVEIECEASAVPEKIEVSINHLELNQAIHVADLELPSNATAVTDPTAIVVNCAPIVEASEEAEAAEGGVEPEVISRKKSEEEE